MKQSLLLAVCLGLSLGKAWCQSAIGLPAIRSYTHADYHAAIEAWDIGQDKQGLLYFANNDGLLTFDGGYWKTYPLPNKVTIKSLAIDRQGRVFVGGGRGGGECQKNGKGSGNRSRHQDILQRLVIARSEATKQSMAQQVDGWIASLRSQ